MSCFTVWSHKHFTHAACSAQSRLGLVSVELLLVLLGEKWLAPWLEGGGGPSGEENWSSSDLDVSWPFRSLRHTGHVPCCKNTLKCDVLTHGHCTDINKHASPYTDSKKQTASQVRFKNCIQKNSSHTVCTKSNLKPLMIISAFCFCSSLFNDVCLLVILSLPRKCWWNFEKHSVKSLVTVQWSRRDCLMLSTVTQSCAVATKASDVCKNAILLYLHTFVQSVQIVAVYISYPLFHFVFFHSGCSPSCTTGKIAIIFCQWHHPSGHTQQRWTNHWKRKGRRVRKYLQEVKPTLLCIHHPPTKCRHHLQPSHAWYKNNK